MLALTMGAPCASLIAQSDGALAGSVRSAAGAYGLAGAELLVDGRVAGATDTAGRYRVRGIRSGWHRVAARLIGYRGIVRDSVFVRGGLTVRLDFTLTRNPQRLDPVVVAAPYDAVLDPLSTSTQQKITAADLRELPVSTLAEAVALSAGAVGESYRGGRLGESSFILDGLGVKNQLDASGGGIGIRVPPDILSEAALVTNGFSARYGQALSGIVNAVTRDPGAGWEGRIAYEGDRPFGGSLDRGLDRLVAGAGGPIAGGIGFVAAVDISGRLDADAVAAPAPTDPRDPRSSVPYPLPHNAGETWSGVGKLLVPLGERMQVRLLGVHSEDQRLLFDPAYKYDVSFAPAQRSNANLASGHLHIVSDPRSDRALIVDLRVGRYTREFIRGTLATQPDYRIGAITSRPFHFIGEELARDQVVTSDPVAGLRAPELSDATPWGVPAFFLSSGSNGELGWNRFGETRVQADLIFGAARRIDVYAGGEWVSQQVRSWQRVDGYLSAGGSVPPATSSAFSPTSLAAYVETQLRLTDLAVTAGVRYDQFDAGSAAATESRGAQRSVTPRFAVSTVLKGATVVASFGRFTQAPDYQFLVDAAFDDTTRTGRFRRGNPNLGFEKATQYELSVRVRPTATASLRVGAYVKRLDGLVASVPLGLNPDSTIFGNADGGTVKGVELVVEREFQGRIGIRASYTLQSAEATATDPFLLNRVVSVDPATGDTIRPARAEFPLDYDQRHTLTAIVRGRARDRVGPRLGSVRPLAGLEVSVIVRAESGLPYTRAPLLGDTVQGLANDSRLPASFTIDLLFRRPVRLGGVRGGIYLDLRNLLNRRNLVAVRRDIGAAAADTATVNALAEDAYEAHPEAIPYESARYRSEADANRDGYLSGREELFPLFLAAARDFTQPIFAYGAPRLARLGLEFVF